MTERPLLDRIDQQLVDEMRDLIARIKADAEVIETLGMLRLNLTFYGDDGNTLTERGKLTAYVSEWNDGYDFAATDIEELLADFVLTYSRFPVYGPRSGERDRLDALVADIANGQKSKQAMPKAVRYLRAALQRSLDRINGLYDDQTQEEI